jgi:hypothetical protein
MSRWKPGEQNGKKKLCIFNYHLQLYRHKVFFWTKIIIKLTLYKIKRITKYENWKDSNLKS